MDKRKKTYYAGADKNLDYEVRDISWITLLWIGALIFFGTIIIVIGLNEYFIYAKEQKVYELVLQPESEELKQMLAKEDSVLTNYNRRDDGGFTMPIDSAMAKIATEYKNE